MTKLRVLFHVNEMDRWNCALRNVENLLTAVGPEGAEIVMIGNGESVIAYDHSPLLETMGTLSQRGVSFLACRNSLRTMRERGKITLADDQVPLFVTTVPAGIVAIIEKQHAGFAYVKP